MLVLLPGMALAEAPLSAIDWLSQSVATPAAMPVAVPDEPAVSAGATPADIATSVLDGPAPDAVGLLPPAVTGLPRNLWGLGRSAEIAAAVRAERAEPLPALQSLLFTLLLAEADPPADAGGGGALLLARIDKLLDLGALDPAGALLEAAGTGQADLFRRAFDVALLTGNEDAACSAMRDNPTLAPTFPARIFCLARSGDWNAAALTLRTAQALGFVTDEEDALLSRFLDPELADGAEPLPTPTRPSPLVWRMLEAIGEPLPTQSLPLAFAHAELRSTAGWKAQIEATERLARSGAVAPNQLLGIYSEREPAASGGVWDRVEAVQKFDAAMAAGDLRAVAQTLPVAWARMMEAELEVPFAAIYGAALTALPLTGAADALAFRVALLSPSYAAAAQDHRPADASEAFLQALALGDLANTPPPDSLARAIAPAFLAPVPDAQGILLLAQGRLGEAMLLAIDSIGAGLQGEPAQVTAGLSLLRRFGLEDAARRTALELMLLERRG